MEKTNISGSRRMADVVERITGWKLAEVREHVHIRVEHPPLMPLSIEAWNDEDTVIVSVTHYGMLNGDLMADPDVMFAYIDGDLKPLHFQNDYVAIYQRVAEVGNGLEILNRRGYNELVSFADSWADNLRAEGFCGVRQ